LPDRLLKNAQMESARKERIYAFLTVLPYAATTKDEGNTPDGPFSAALEK
jgi:hypothetical protein